MTAPPSAIPPSELWVQMVQMPRPFRLVDVPRKDPVTKLPIGQIAVWILTQEETMICQAAADTFARKSMKDGVPKNNEASEGYTNLYRNAAAVEVLFRACRRMNDLKMPAFPSPGEMRKNFSHDEIGILMDHYHRVQSEIGPYVSECSAEELDAWIRVLEEGGSRHFLDLLTSETKEALVERLVSRLSSLRTAIGSPGSPQETSSSDDDPSHLEIPDVELIPVDVTE